MQRYAARCPFSLSGCVSRDRLSGELQIFGRPWRFKEAAVSCVTIQVFGALGRLYTTYVCMISTMSNITFLDVVC